MVRKSVARMERPPRFGMRNGSKRLGCCFIVSIVSTRSYLAYDYTILFSEF